MVRSMMSRSRCAHGAWLLYNHKRLSATDISAHASMKNVAKCDTWCELQNPVNHRVFERKLRPKPFGGGHVCLGVTHRVAPTIHSFGMFGWGRILVSRSSPSGWPKQESPLKDARLEVVDKTAESCCVSFQNGGS